ncbi:helix-turn-helix domain-containing protein [Streptomyces sp. enrichment culture]|uniref:helix-turn-helix domain-containing protein n=1 Tax=Streptomyces sp. enrichment culture TaxID=1795815 RepID=UPI003F56D8EB
MAEQDDVARFAALLRALKERTDRSYGSLARRLAMNTSTLHRYCAGEAVPVDFAPVERFAALCGASPDERLDLHRHWLLAVAARQRPRGAAADRSAEEAGPARGEGADGSEDAANAPSTAENGRAAHAASAPHSAGAAQSADTARGEGADTAHGQEPGAAHGQEPGAARGEGADTARGHDPDTAHGQEAGTVTGAARDTGASEKEKDDATAAAAGKPVVREPVGEPVAGKPVVGEPVAEGALPRRPWYRRRRLAVGLAAACAVFATLGSLAALPDGRRAAADGRARATSPVTPGAPETGASERGGASRSPSASPKGSSPSADPEEKGKTEEREKGNEKGKPGPAPSGRTTAPPRSGTAPAAPLTWSADSQAWKLGCGHDYVITRPPAQVPPPPVPQDAGAWAASENAVHGGETLVRLSVQGRSDTAVVLDALRVRVVGRAAPVQGNAYAMDQGCGGSITPRSFDVDLDKDRPIARAVAGSDAGTPIPAVSMPYRVSARDPEVLLVNARTRGCDCRWYLELDWSSQGRSGTVRIDDGGRPFRTSGIAGLPRYLYDTSARQWTPYR